MKSRLSFALSIVTIVLLSWVGSANADTIITFVELPRERGAQVFIDGQLVRTVAGESADTVGLVDPGFFKGPLGRRLCPGCPTGIFGAALFEPGTSVISDFVIANVVFGGFPGAVDSDFFFASDPDILALANKFNKGLDLLNALQTKAPKTFETGEEQVLQFFDLNGVLTPLPSGPVVPFFFTGGDIVIKVVSDVERVPEPSTSLLFGSALAGLVLFRRRKIEGGSRPSGLDQARQAASDLTLSATRTMDLGA